MMATSFHRAIEAGGVTDQAPTGVVVAGWPVLLARDDGRLVALMDRCSHAASELSTGRIRRGSIMCPLHGARFELASGRCLGAAYPALMTFETREADGWIEVAVPDEAPGFEHRPVRAKR